MNIRNLVLISLLSLASLQTGILAQSVTISNGQTVVIPDTVAPKTSGIISWARIPANAQDKAARAEALIKGNYYASQNQKASLQALITAVQGNLGTSDGATSAEPTPPAETSPTQAEKDAAAAKAEAAALLTTARDTAKTEAENAAKYAANALQYLNETNTLVSQGKKSEAQAEATKANEEASKAKTAANAANSAIKGYESDSTAQTYVSGAESAATKADQRAQAAQSAVDGMVTPSNPDTGTGETKTPGDTTPDTGTGTGETKTPGDTTPDTGTGTGDTTIPAHQEEAARLVQEIADKVNATPYAAALKAKLNSSAPVSGTPHRSKTLGRLGKDTAKKTTKKSRVKTAHKYA